MNSPQIIIYTDGACTGNPGPGGWGALLTKGERQLELSGGEKSTTNNRMELQAAIEGLKALKRPSKVVLFSDSRYLINGITTWIHSWKRNNWQRRPSGAVKNVDLWQEIDRLNSVHAVSWQWVKGHSGDAGNEKADQLAREAIPNE